MLMTSIGMVVDVPVMRLILAVVVLVILIILCWLVLRPEIAKIFTYVLLQYGLNVDATSVMMYFYTDDVEQLPSGPHLSRFFVTTVMGTSSTVLSCVGIGLYNRF